MRARFSLLTWVWLSGSLACSPGCAERSPARPVREDVPTTMPASTPPDTVPARSSEEQEEGVTQARMRELGRRAAAGDLKALDELESIHEALYHGINYERERSRVLTNLNLMRAAFDVIGEAAGEGRPEAMRALLAANGRRELHSWTADAFGIAAGMGNREALNVLLEYRKHGMLLSSVVFALKPAARRNDPSAVDFLVQVLEDPKARPLWQGAADGLEEAASAGSQRATDALQRHREKE